MKDPKLYLMPPPDKQEYGTEVELHRAGTLQVVGGIQYKAGKRVKLKARHLRKSTRSLLARNLLIHQSSQDAAQAFREEGITGALVIDSALVEVMERLARVEGMLAVRFAA